MNIILAVLAALAFHLVGYLPVTASIANGRHWAQLSFGN